MTLCSVCFSRVSDSLYSLVLLLRNKLPEDEEWPHFQNVHHCLKKKNKKRNYSIFLTQWESFSVPSRNPLSQKENQSGRQRSPVWPSFRGSEQRAVVPSVVFIDKFLQESPTALPPSDVATVDFDGGDFEIRH